MPELVTVEGEIRSAVHEDALALYDRVMAVFAEEADRIGASAEGDRVIRLRAYRIADDDPALALYKEVLRRRGIAPYAKPSFPAARHCAVREAVLRRQRQQRARAERHPRPVHI